MRSKQTGTGERECRQEAGSSDLKEAEEAIARGAPWTVANLLELSSASPKRDFVLGKALVKCVEANWGDKVGAAVRARDYLAPLLFCNDPEWPREERREEVLELLVRVAQHVDPDLAKAIAGEPALEGRWNSEDVLKAFYFGGARTGQSWGERAFAEKAALKSRLAPTRAFIEDDFFIEFLKNYSSFTPLLASAKPESLGGGYFASFGGYCCVIDPGHHFLDNFFAQGLFVGDVDCIFVTHFHDDHFSDLPALLSLLHQRYQSDASTQVSLFADSQTLHMFRPIIKASPYITQCKIISPNSAGWNSLNDHVSFRGLPTEHRVLGRGRSGVGLAFRIRRARVSYLVITGDTGWEDRLGSVYRQFRDESTTLVAHLSTVTCEDVKAVFDSRGQHFYRNHLGVHGVCKAIEAVQPRTVVLSEVGEELKDVIQMLADIISRVYNVRCTVCRIGHQEFL